MISVTVRPNFERKPPDDCQRPLPRDASLTRMPICGRTPIFSAASRISASSVYFSTTGMMLRPDLLGQHRRFDELGVLEAVADDRRLVVGERDHGEQFRLGPCLEAELVGPAELEDFLDDLPLLVDLDRVDAAVAALVLVLRDRRLEGGVDIAQAVLQDVGEAHQDRKADAAELQPIDQLLQVDRLRRILGRVHLDVPGRVHREVAVAPARAPRRARSRRAPSTPASSSRCWRQRRRGPPVGHRAHLAVMINGLRSSVFGLRSSRGEISARPRTTRGP